MFFLQLARAKLGYIICFYLFMLLFWQWSNWYKLHLTSEMTDNDVECEIWSIFQGTMQNDPNFSFLYLQVTGVGAKSLTIPSQSSTFNGLHSRWLASLASWAQFIYGHKLTFTTPLKRGRGVHI